MIQRHFQQHFLLEPSDFYQHSFACNCAAARQKNVFTYINFQCVKNVWNSSFGSVADFFNKNVNIQQHRSYSIPSTHTHRLTLTVYLYTDLTNIYISMFVLKQGDIIFVCNASNYIANWVFVENLVHFPFDILFSLSLSRSILLNFSPFNEMMATMEKFSYEIQIGKRSQD